MEKKPQGMGFFMLRQIKQVMVALRIIWESFFFWWCACTQSIRMHSHACTRTHANLWTLLSWQRLGLMLASTCWSQCFSGTHNAVSLFFFPKALAISLTQISCCPFGRLCTLGREPYLKKKKSSLMFDNVSFNSYKSDYTVNTHPAFTCLKPPDSCKT